jgi:hypothetical protein
MDELRVLLFNFPQEMIALRLGLLSRPPFAVDAAPNPVELVRRLETVRYRMAILGLPAQGVGFKDILPLARGEGHPNTRCILIVLATPDRLEEMRPFLGKGLNALLSRSATPVELEAEIARQTHVAPRVETRQMVRLKAKIAQTPSALICQTLNISASGMFLSSMKKVPIGTVIDFELALPRLKLPVSGQARVVRHSLQEKEKRDGMGAAFLSFRIDGREKLMEFLSRLPQPTKK